MRWFVGSASPRTKCQKTKCQVATSTCFRVSLTPARRGRPPRAPGRQGILEGTSKVRLDCIVK
eukprot:191818-Pyramimonas_sp.AAC.1